MSKNIINFNSKGERHGYFERYWGGILWYKCLFHNGIRIDYEEYYSYYCNDGLQKIFYI